MTLASTDSLCELVGNALPVFVTTLPLLAGLPNRIRFWYQPTTEAEPPGWLAVLDSTSSIPINVGMVDVVTIVVLQLLLV